MKTKKGTGNREQGTGGFLGGIVRGFLAAALCAVGLSAFAAGTGTQSDPWLIGSPNEEDVEAWKDDSGKLTIAGAGKMMDWARLDDVPWYFDQTLTSIEICNGVTSIGHYAFFYQTGATQVEIAGSVTEIGPSAFANCSALTGLVIPEGVKNIGAAAFSSCSGLKQVTISSTVTNIVGNAFAYCSKLETVTFAGVSELKSIGYNAFRYDSSLVGLEVPASVTSIDSGAFVDAPNVTVNAGNAAYEMVNGLLCDKRTMTVVSGIDGAEVTIPSSMTSIAEGAFGSSLALRQVTISAGVTNIVDWAFQCCENLTNVTFEAGSQLETIGEGAFGYYIPLLGEIEIPASVKSIGDEAFYDCEGLSNVTVRAITPPEFGTDVFAYCAGDLTIYVPYGTGDAYKAAPGWSDYKEKIVELDPPVDALSNKFALDLTAGDRVAQDTETLVIDPAWGEAATATVAIEGESSPRTYMCASNDTWQTAALAAGRYAMAFTAGATNETAAFWKTGDDWVIFDSSNITADVTFEAGKTYLVLGTNTVDATLTVTDGAKFEYDKVAPAGFLGGTVAELPKRYRKTAGELYQIVEKVKGCEDNPWEVGGTDGTDDLVTAWTNGTELVIDGAGTVTNLADIAKGGLKAITITKATVTGAEKDAFKGVGGEDTVMLTLPDGWQGELPDEDGNWYGATDVTLTAYPQAVKNVTFQQRYPWNGLVDVTCDLSGAGTATLSATVLTNGVTLVKNPTLEGVLTLDLGEGCATNGVKFIWNAAEDLPAGFKAGGVTIKVTADIIPPPPAGQLWENGPIWGTSNFGTPKDGKPAAYGDLYTFHQATNAVAQLDGGWRLPTQEELEALVANCDREWTTQDAVPGWLFKGQGAFEGNSVFLPNAGYNPGPGRQLDGTTGTYWSSTPDGESDDAFYLYLTQGSEPDVTVGDMDSNRLSVRLVKDAR